LRSTKALPFEAAFLKAATGPAGAWIVAAELFDQFFILTDNAITALDVRLTAKSPSGVCSSIQKLKS
jgi:hypothetical protein